MIIKIEDAPAVKHITIDIDFTGDGSPITVIQETKDALSGSGGAIHSKRDDTLNLDEDFTEEAQEEVQKPEIQHEDRVAKVSTEMNDMEL